jgi:hypothetical protein
MFRRRKAATPDEPGGTPDLEALGQPDPRANGPWDGSEIDVEEPDENRVDLGSLLLTAREGVEIQLQVDESTGEVAAALLAAEDGAIELRAFAAPRHVDIWDDVRRDLAGEVTQMGGTATETTGAFGPAVSVSMNVQLPDGSRAQQASTVLGIPGPRWLLRATLFGRPAVAYDEKGALEQALRDVVVVRGSGPIPPGDALPLTMPPSARRMS